VRNITTGEKAQIFFVKFLDNYKAP